MKWRSAVFLILVSLPVPALVAQPASKATSEAYSEELTQFRAFIAQHPRALAELKKDPSLISSPEFVKSHRVVGQYITNHPKVKEGVKANPDFFKAITARTPGGKHRPSPKRKIP
jgi:hypothetical protein